jgi:RHS repeat-associated protein
VEFDFAAENPAFFQEIGFDTDTTWGVGAEANRYFDLGGLSHWNGLANADFREDTLPDGTIHVQIPIGEYLSDSEKAQGLDLTQLVFLNFDPWDSGGTSIFSNLKLYESDEVRTVTTYDPRGNVATVKTASDPRNITTSYEYDRLGRQTNKTLDAGGAMERQYVTRYDAAGNVLVEQDPSGAVGSGETVQTVHEYDRLGRLVKTTLPDPDGLASTPNGLITTFVYDAVGNLIRQTNGEGETTRTSYDAQGHTISETDGNGDTTRYRYDSEGNLRAVTDAEQNVTKYTYDGLNRQTTETITALVNGQAQPLVRTNAYNLQGNLASTTDRNGRVRVFTYDALDRRTKEEWKNTASGSVVRKLTWQYDDLNRVVREADDSGTTSTTSDDLVDTFAYDGLGRLTEERNYDPAITGGGTSQPQVHQTYGYGFEYLFGTAYDRVTRNQYLRSGGSDVGLAKTVSTFDRLGQLQLIDDQDSSAGSSSPQVSSKSASFGYDAAGNLSQIDRGPVSSFYSYDQANRLTEIDHDYGADVPIKNFYSFDDASRITSFVSVSQDFGPDDRRFQYDDAGQLVAQASIDPEYGDFYQYDDNGNRIGTKNYSPDPYGSWTNGLADRLIDDGTYTYDYDPEGNLTKRTLKSNTALTTEYGWDQRNRLVSVTEKNGASVTKQVNYTYDAEDRRVARAYDADGGTPNFTNEYFVYDGSDLALRFGSSQELTHRYLYGPLVDQVLVDESFKAATSGQRVTNDVLWQLADHQGSVRDIVDSNGTVRKHTDYDSFGNVTSEIYYAKNGSLITSQHAEAVDALFGYTGQEQDTATGLYNYNARWYDPRIGRWLSEDPIFAPNLYPYVGNDPIDNTDPTGLFQQGNPVLSLYSTPSVSDYSTWARSQPNWDVNVSNGLSAAQFASGLRDYQDKLSRDSDILAHNMELGAIGGVDDPAVRAVNWALANPRVQGTLQVTTGIAQLGVASAATAIPVVGAPLGVLIALRAADNIGTGTYKLASGQQHDTVGQIAISQGLQQAGVSPQTSHAVADYGTAGFDLATTLPAALSRPAPAPEGVTAGPVATSAAGKSFISPGHLTAAAGEYDLIQEAQKAGEVVLKVNRTVTDNGADLVSYNPKTGQVTLWDNKATIGVKTASGGRAPTSITPSSTLNKPSTLKKVLNDASDAIRNSNLSPADQTRAMESLENGYRKVTRGSGNAKNSVIQKGP